ncbi:MAG: hypothetical protein CM15mP49_00090 [Actinomycetota bacterium]|nr:MAG: hypothetical protein CM15mP49_00090 [Actinomycetota bacterium]
MDITLGILERAATNGSGICCRPVHTCLNGSKTFGVPLDDFLTGWDPA